MKILSATQIRQADEHTIRHTAITSLELMERAAEAFREAFMQPYTESSGQTLIFCGTGNNGGDGLAFARLWGEEFSDVQVFIIGDLQKSTPDFTENYRKLPKRIPLRFLTAPEDFPEVHPEDIVVDALFGSGLNRPVEGLHAQLIHHLNHSQATIVSIDIASGLFADTHTPGEAIIRPAVTVSFQVPKLAFMLPQNEKYVGKWIVKNIGLDEKFIASQETPFHYLEEKDVVDLLPQKRKFMHKGDNGRLLLVAGGKGKMGAAILAARAALRSGAGLLYAHVPKVGRDVMQGAVPEVMVSEDKLEDAVSIIAEYPQMDAIAIGPGIGVKDSTVHGLGELLTKWKGSLILDADALNCLSKSPELLKELPQNTLLTPHPGEFSRLVGEWVDEFQRLDMMRAFCQKYQVNMVLKGAHSAICDSYGTVWFNSTGNPGMAKGGSGDVLTGILGALLAQGIRPIDTLKLGVFLHGRAGDLAAESLGHYSVTASDIIDHLPRAFLSLYKAD